MVNGYIYKLVLAAAVILAGSAVTCLIGITWSSLVAKVFRLPPSKKFRKWWTTVCLGLPILILIALARDNYDSLFEWWSKTSVVISVSFLVALVVVLVLLVGAIIAIWRPVDSAGS